MEKTRITSQVSADEFREIIDETEIETRKEEIVEMFNHWRTIPRAYGFLMHPFNEDLLGSLSLNEVNGVYAALRCYSERYPNEFPDYEPHISFLERAIEINPNSSLKFPSEVMWRAEQAATAFENRAYDKIVDSIGRKHLAK